MTKSLHVSNKRPSDPIHFEDDYPLQGTSFDVPLLQVLNLPPQKRTQYIHALLKAFHKEITKEQMWMTQRVPFKREMRDLRRLLDAPADQYLRMDDKFLKRNILGKGSPGSTHAYWSRTHMWKMTTKGGDIAALIKERSPRLVHALERLLDLKVTSKAFARDHKKSVIQNVLQYFTFEMGLRCAFPPFHAKFFADRYLPRDGDSIIVDPCAGWGGRLVGSLCVNRPGHVRYYGVDPERRNQVAYKGLVRRLNIYLKRELPGRRTGRVFCAPFEDWIHTKFATALRGRVDLVITSPPYFSAEQYNTANKKQSASRYRSYAVWCDHFYRPLMRGAFDLLKPGGVFVLNIANVKEAPHLERDARAFAREVGFSNGGFYKMAMSALPQLRKSGKLRHAITVNKNVFKYEPVFVFQRPGVRRSDH